MRKIFKVILLVIVLIAVNYTYTIFAQNSPKIYITNATASAGTEVSISVKLSALGAAGSNFTVEYNPAELEYISHKTFGGASANATASNGTIKVGFASANAINGEETVITIAFKIKGSANGSVIPLTLSDVKVFDENGQQIIDVSVSNGAITVGAPPHPVHLLSLQSPQLLKSRSPAEILSLTHIL